AVASPFTRQKRQPRTPHLEEQVAERVVEDAAAGRHRAEGVAVVRVLDRDEERALRLAAIPPVLVGHLQRRLDRGGAVIGEEDARELAGNAARELRGEPRRRLVRETREDDLREPRSLLRES